MVPMTTRIRVRKHQRGMAGLEDYVADRHFLNCFKFRAPAAALCALFALCSPSDFLLKFVFILLELSTLKFQDSFMLSRRQSFSVYLGSLG